MTRAGEIINRIRGMVKKAPAHREALNINDTITEVMALVLSEVRRNAPLVVKGALGLPQRRPR